MTSSKDSPRAASGRGCLFGSGPYRAVDEPPIQLHVVLGHPRCREALEKGLATALAPQRRHALDCRGGVLDALDDESRHAVLDQLGHRAAWKGDACRAA